MKLSEKQITRLRENFAAYTAGQHHVATPLNTIAMVGAIPSSRNKSGLGDPDETLLEKALQTLSELGYTVASDFDVTIVNINEEFGGLDYMNTSEPERFDISIFCFIMRIKHDYLRTRNENNNYIKNSPFETRNKHAWLNAALGHDSKILMTHGTPGKEVSSRDFKGGWTWNKSPYQLKHSEPFRFHGLNAFPDAELQVMAHKDIH